VLAKKKEKMVQKGGRTQESSEGKCKKITQRGGQKDPSTPGLKNRPERVEKMRMEEKQQKKECCTTRRPANKERVLFFG